MNEVRLHPPGPTLDPQLTKRFTSVTVSALGDSLQRCFAAVGIRPIGDSLSGLDGQCMVGPALTVRTRPGDNLAVHKALDLARPGDVVAVDARGEVVNAIIGELMTRYAARRRIAGFVIDGAIRDSGPISQGPLPVFARGISPMGPYKTGPGEIHCPITLGGVAIHDGDVLVGDVDGVLAVPRGRADTTIEAAENLIAQEDTQREAIDADSWDRTWIDKSLQLIKL